MSDQPTPESDAAWRRSFRHGTYEVFVTSQKLERQRDQLLVALREVEKVLTSDDPAIVDTVWVADGRPETLLDCVVAAIAAAEGKEGAISQVDPTVAPPGFYAIPEVDGCEGCAFEPDSGVVCLSRPCAASDRPDGQDVIFLPVAGDGEGVEP